MLQLHLYLKHGAAFVCIAHTNKQKKRTHAFLNKRPGLVTETYRDESD